MAKHLYGLVLVLGFTANGAFASSERSFHVHPKRIIVRFDSQLKTQEVESFLQNPEVEKVEVLVPDLNLFSVTFKNSSAGRGFIRAFSSSRGLVRYAQPDHVVKLRQNPNDPDLEHQWSLNGISSKGNIQAAEAWELGTGGKTAQGDEIVVAVVDGGTDIHHSDLKNNLWVNKQEIPGNDKDDDDNGFIDDVNGWNAYEESGNLVGEPQDMNFMHGTHVAGIIGAQGNNGLQVTGINWQTKIMGVSGSSGETSVVAKAYGYVIAQKKLWLKTGGKKGANVVVTNSSFGVDNADCSSPDFVIWNDLYNEMGKLGILSVVATANADVDVDKEGDVPSACKSPFIVAVTNTDSEDERYSSGAGYGARSIHLGAPGTDIISTVPGNKTKKLTGTSMATPHVSGSIALLHHIASKRFSQFYKKEPAEAAKELKKVLLESVDLVSSLTDITVTGGRLNVFKAANTLSKY